MSARADITPLAYVRELSTLQDGTASQPFAQVRRMVEQSLCTSCGPNTTIEDVFSFFDPVALASASIAQVHRATLRTNGQHVVVKVQHQGIGEIMRLDMAALLNICRLVAYFEPEFDVSFSGFSGCC